MDDYGDGPWSCLGSAWPERLAVGMLQPPYQSGCQIASFAMLDGLAEVERWQQSNRVKAHKPR